MAGYLFYLFAAFALVSALAVVGCRNPVNGALALVLAFIGVAGVFFMLEAPFVGTLLLLVYGGAVIVLLLFVVMLLDTDRTERRPVAWRTDIFALLLLALLGAGVCWFVNAGARLPAADANGVANAIPAAVPLDAGKGIATGGVGGEVASVGYASGAKALGRLMFVKYMLPVQVAGFLLLVAAAGVAVIAGRRREL